MEIDTWTAALGAIAAGAVIYLGRYLWERLAKKEEPAAAIAPPAPPYLAVLVEIRDTLRRLVDAVEEVDDHQVMVDIARGQQQEPRVLARRRAPRKKPPAP